MPVRISDIVAKRRKTLTLLVTDDGFKAAEDGYEPKEGEDYIRLTYDLGGLTAASEESFLKASRGKDARNLAVTVDFFLLLVREWDLQDEHGKVIPLTKEALHTVPTAVITEALNAVLQEARLSGEASGPSGST